MSSRKRDWSFVGTKGERGAALAQRYLISHLRPRRAALAAAALLMDLTSHAVRRLSPATRERLAGAAAALWIWCWRRRLPVIAQNFAVVLGRAPAGTGPLDPQACALARESLRSYARMAIDFLLVRTMQEPEVLAWVQPVGAHHLEAARQDRKGVIFVLPHLGSWDVAAAFAHAYGCRLTIVVESGWMAELVAGSRLARGATLVPRQGSLRALFRALAREEIVVLLTDVIGPGVATIEVPFFGRPAPFPAGPARLAQRTGAPILVVSCVRLPDGRYRIEAQPPLRPDPALPPREAVYRLTAAIAAGFERAIAAAPAQWYPFHSIWPDLAAGVFDGGDRRV